MVPYKRIIIKVSLTRYIELTLGRNNFAIFMYISQISKKSESLDFLNNYSYNSVYSKKKFPRVLYEIMSKSEEKV